MVYVRFLCRYTVCVKSQKYSVTSSLAIKNRFFADIQAIFGPHAVIEESDVSLSEVFCKFSIFLFDSFIIILTFLQRKVRMSTERGPWGGGGGTACWGFHPKWSKFSSVVHQGPEKWYMSSSSFKGAIFRPSKNVPVQFNNFSPIFFFFYAWWWYFAQLIIGALKKNWIKTTFFICTVLQNYSWHVLDCTYCRWVPVPLFTFKLLWCY